MEAEFITYRAEHRDITRTVATESPIHTYRNRSYVTGAKFPDKFLRRYTREYHVEMDYKQAVHAEFLYHNHFFIQRGKQRGGRFLGRDDSDRMRGKGDNKGFSTVSCCGVHRTLDHCLVTHMNPIENAECKVQRLIHCCQLLQPVDPNQHRNSGPAH